MGIAMRAVFSVLLGAAVAACTAPGLPPEFTEQLARGDPGMGRIVVRGGEIEVVSAPVAAVDLPQRVAVAVEAIEPGGTTLEIARVWRSGVESFAVAKRYGEGDAAQRRSAWLTADGAVIERTHQVPEDEIEPAVVRAVAGLALGEIELAEVVQAEPGTERYRFALRRADGARFAVECGLDGTDVRIARRLTAEVRAWR